MPTISCCPACRRILDAEKVVRGDRVYLDRTCPVHGKFSVLVGKDAGRFFDKTFSSVGKPAHRFQTEVHSGCPDDCGFCPRHRQHICSSLIEITGQCDLRCPTCYFRQFNLPPITPADFRKRVQTLLDAENGRLDVLQLSGGEPTLHPRFIEILDDACSHNIARVVINTNGLTLLRNLEVYQAVRARRDRVEVYLQFDGFNRQANAGLRGRDLLDEKKELINRLDRDAVKMCLAMTVNRETLDEVGNVLEFAIRTRHVSGTTFQRQAWLGNARAAPPVGPLPEDILAALAASGRLEYRHLVPLPCSHENCTSISFLFVANGRTYSLADFIDYARHQEVLRNRIALDAGILHYLRDQISGGRDGCCSWWVRQTPAARRLREFTEGDGSCQGNLKMLRIVVKNFMDAFTFDAERAEKCCFGVAVGGGRIVPFCVQNIFHREVHPVA